MCERKIAELIFSNNATFQFRFDSPQVKRDLISAIVNFVYELLPQLLNG